MIQSIDDNLVRKRDYSIDAIKGFLTLLMITAHIIQFFPAGNQTNFFSDYVNLTTFSGFMFTFGYVSYNAYLRNTNRLIQRLGKGFIKTYIAFCISGIAYSVLIERLKFFDIFIPVVTLQKVPGYSEFLLSFSIVYLFVFFIQFIRIDISFIIGGLVIVSLLSTLINYGSIDNNIIGSILGTNKYACFPLLQYSFYFWMGIYLAEKDIIFDKRLLVLSFVNTFIFGAYIYENRAWPSRFPPSLYWVVGGHLFIYSYYIFFKRIEIIKKHKLIFLRNVGSKSLLYLVISNVIIFMMHRVFGELIMKIIHSYFNLLLIYFVIFVLCLGATKIVCQIVNNIIVKN